MEKAYSNGFIVLNRKMVEWEWFKNANTFTVFLHLLLLANWKDSRFEGTPVPKGSLITSYASLSEQCGLSVREVRTALEHLEQTGEITRKSTNRWQGICVVNWAKYQDQNLLATSDRQATDKRPTTTKQRNKETKKECMENPPTLQEIKEYVKEKNLQVDTQKFFNYFSEGGWVDSKGNPVRNWKQKLITWSGRGETHPEPKVREVYYPELE